jgi:hypothetical protein
VKYVARAPPRCLACPGSWSAPRRRWSTWRPPLKWSAVAAVVSERSPTVAGGSRPETCPWPVVRWCWCGPSASGAVATPTARSAPGATTIPPSPRARRSPSGPGSRSADGWAKTRTRWPRWPGTSASAGRADGDGRGARPRPAPGGRPRSPRGCGGAGTGRDGHGHARRHRRTTYVTGIVDLDRGWLCDIDLGRSGSVVETWLAERDGNWLANIGVVTLDPFRGYANGLLAQLRHACVVLGHFHAVRLANAAVDDVRRRVQQDTFGHRGRKGDPLYGIRSAVAGGRRAPRRAGPCPHRCRADRRGPLRGGGRHLA